MVVAPSPTHRPTRTAAPRHTRTVSGGGATLPILLAAGALTAGAALAARELDALRSDRIWVSQGGTTFCPGCQAANA